jgi:hypothetical protein
VDRFWREADKRMMAVICFSFLTVRMGHHLGEVPHVDERTADRAIAKVV